MDPKKLTGTETEKNLWVAFSGESQARMLEDGVAFTQMRA